MSVNTPGSPSPVPILTREMGIYDAPQMKCGTSVLRIVGHAVARVEDDLCVEQPLQVRIAGEDVAVLMRTPGDDHALATGYLFTEGIISGVSDVFSIGPCAGPTGEVDPNTINVIPSDPHLLQPERWLRSSHATSSCGVCGKVSTRQIFRGTPTAGDEIAVNLETLYALTDRMSDRQEGFGRTGGLHAASLFDTEGNLQVLMEDVGRHNAVDKVIGHALLDGCLPLSSMILLVSSRASFEIVQKAATAGIQIMAVISAPSSMAVQTAQEAGMTLIAFLRERRLNIYAGEHRVVLPNSP